MKGGISLTKMQTWTSEVANILLIQQNKTHEPSFPGFICSGQLSTFFQFRLPISILILAPWIIYTVDWWLITTFRFCLYSANDKNNKY
jgi:hypothetical protein